MQVSKVRPRTSPEKALGGLPKRLVVYRRKAKGERGKESKERANKQYPTDQDQHTSFMPHQRIHYILHTCILHVCAAACIHIRFLTLADTLPLPSNLKPTPTPKLLSPTTPYFQILRKPTARKSFLQLRDIQAPCYCMNKH